MEQLAEQATFIEVAYLLIYGELPTANQLEDFNTKIARRMMLDERMRELFRAFPRGAHPMQVLASGVIAVGVQPRHPRYP
nr:citrate/2-methylcitrate synthase [Tessaracoccus sp.]